MSRLFPLTLAFFLLNAGTTISQGQPSEEAMREASVNFLKTAIDHLLQNPEISVYFPNVTVDKISLEQTKLPAAKGWIYRWPYEHDVHYIPNPDHSVQTAFKPVFANNRGIVFTIFAYQDNGSAMVSRIKDYTVSEKLKLHIGLYLQTKDENALLFHKIDGIIKAELPAFQKAISD